MNYFNLKQLLRKKYGSIFKAAKEFRIPYLRLLWGLTSSQGLRLRDVDIIATQMSVNREDFASIFLQNKFKY